MIQMDVDRVACVALGARGWLPSSPVDLALVLSEIAGELVTYQQAEVARSAVLVSGFARRTPHGGHVDRLVLVQGDRVAARLQPWAVL